MSAPICNKERFKVDYAEVGDLIRHYSTVRSALTTFLLTVSVGSFVAYHKDSSHSFLLVVGYLFLLVSAAACLVFSYRTESATLYQKALWKWSNGEDPYTNGDYPSRHEIRKSFKWKAWRRVCSKDTMNLFLVMVIVVIFVSFQVPSVADSVSGPAEADHFGRAAVLVTALFVCLAAMVIFGTVQDSRRFVGATIATIFLCLLAGMVGYLLLVYKHI